MQSHNIFQKSCLLEKTLANLLLRYFAKLLIYMIRNQKAYFFFTAELANNVVDLNWITSSEINNDYFTLQKSKDGLNWIDFAKQEGAGNSNTTISYQDSDYHPYSGTSYYRLKQTDLRN